MTHNCLYEQEEGERGKSNLLRVRTGNSTGFFNGSDGSSRCSRKIQSIYDEKRTKFIRKSSNSTFYIARHFVVISYPTIIFWYRKFFNLNCPWTRFGDEATIRNIASTNVDNSEKIMVAPQFKNTRHLIEYIHIFISNELKLL